MLKLDLNVDFKNEALNYHKEIFFSSLVRSGIWLGLECADAYYNEDEFDHLWKKPIYIGMCLGIDALMCFISGSNMIGLKEAKACKYCIEKTSNGFIKSDKDAWTSTVVIDGVVVPLAILPIGYAIGSNGTGEAITSELPLNIPNPLNIVAQGVNNVLPVPRVSFNWNNLLLLRNGSKAFGMTQNAITWLSLFISDMDELGWKQPA
jgi:hypothetical protein